ncbi:DUF881 domain-containing protein [Amorphoplanes digitatis]|uniref:Uncharacterized protein YlxW (UPF0749 family) n=1 Tax=Actinoplanes digitatis TaxID=1868 RepID=A0A7W7HYZ8_9ACTN|nr:DUF881 domain-containing protein [Actinoplanes digitatis]MBB4763412.1 uncharacterized protein YlxW (UPF0749 family) [Actinoplanes digitatis]GID92230.1 hypothetical protein Adi01nite_16420 [Actinoplanes digitatis]
MTSPDAGDGQRRFTPDFLTELFHNPLDAGYADAAARKARGEGATGTRKAMISGVSMLTLVALGFLLVVAYQQTMAAEPARTQARDTLIEQVQSRRTATSELQDRADRLRAEVADLREKQLGGAAVARLRDMEAQTGLAPVRGPGVKVTVADGPTPVDPLTGERKNEARVRDTDLQMAANALWAAGAEAIAVNGQRLTATSTIRQAGEAILVDFRPVTTPYQVVAIGPDSLADEFRDGSAGRFFRALSTRYGIAYDVADVRNATLDAATEPNLRQAVPADPGSGVSGAPTSPSSKASKGG